MQPSPVYTSRIVTPYNGPYYALGTHTRNELGDVLVANRLNKIGVEIGTHRAVYAKCILDRWPGILHCVDPWFNPEGYDQATLLDGSNGDRQEDEKVAKRTLNPYGRRAIRHFTISSKALSLFADNSLDFVYIDGDHRQEHFRFDLHHWYMKVRPTGMIAGHDWLCPGEKEHGWGKGIQSELHLFCTLFGIDTVYLITEPNQLPWSFYFFKPKAG